MFLYAGYLLAIWRNRLCFQRTIWHLPCPWTGCTFDWKLKLKTSPKAFCLMESYEKEDLSLPLLHYSESPVHHWLKFICSNEIMRVNIIYGYYSWLPWQPRKGKKTGFIWWWFIAPFGITDLRDTQKLSKTFLWNFWEERLDIFFFTVLLHYWASSAHEGSNEQVWGFHCTIQHPWFKKQW